MQFSIHLFRAQHAVHIDLFFYDCDSQIRLGVLCSCNSCCCGSVCKGKLKCLYDCIQREHLKTDQQGPNFNFDILSLNQPTRCVKYDCYCFECCLLPTGYVLGMALSVPALMNIHLKSNYFKYQKHLALILFGSMQQIISRHQFDTARCWIFYKHKM